MQPTLPELACEDVMGDRVQSLAAVKVENITAFLSSAQLVMPS